MPKANSIPARIEKHEVEPLLMACGGSRTPDPVPLRAYRVDEFLQLTKIPPDRLDLALTNLRQDSAKRAPNPKVVAAGFAFLSLSLLIVLGFLLLRPGAGDEVVASTELPRLRARIPLPEVRTDAQTTLRTPAVSQGPVLASANSGQNVPESQVALISDKILPPDVLGVPFWDLEFEPSTPLRPGVRVTAVALECTWQSGDTESGERGLRVSSVEAREMSESLVQLFDHARRTLKVRGFEPTLPAGDRQASFYGKGYGFTVTLETLETKSTVTVAIPSMEVPAAEAKPAVREAANLCVNTFVAELSRARTP
jgi:hypothetical protein